MVRSDTLIYIEGRIESVKRAKKHLHRNTGLRAESILESSLECFAEYDYEKVTIPLISKRTGVTHSLIYYYFANKDALYQSTVLHALYILLNKYKDLLLTEKDPQGMISSYLDLNVEMSETLRSLVRIIFINVDSRKHSEPKFMDSFVEDFYDIEKRILTDFVKKGVEQGVFKCLDPHAFASFISRNIDGIYYGSFMPHGDPIAAAVEYLKNTLFNILCAPQNGSASHLQ